MLVKELFKIKKGKKAIESSEGVRYIQIEDLRNDYNIKYALSNEKNVLCLKNDVLIAWDGANAGTVGYNLEGVLGSTLAKLTPIDKKINTVYAGRFLQSKYQYLRNHCTGATIPHISRPSLENLQIPLPPLPEQKRIAAILDEADKLRQLNTQLIEKYNALTQSLFLEMFGDPVTNPKGWEVFKLKDITTKIGSGSTPKGGKESYKEEGISLIRSLNIHDNFFKMKDLAFIDDIQAEKLKNVIIEKNDVLINITGASVARCSIVPNEVLPARVNQHVSILRCDDKKVNPLFLLHLLISPNCKLKLLGVGSSNGATREAITKEQLEKFQVIVPSIESQDQFELKMISITQQKQQAEAALQKSEDLFNSLLQKAFKGQL
ncbi:restriction endonuclease subunit S [Tenacibaculum sp. 190524A02b]|uniref:restriction endonuclease subunit S n=1 Tax=Tenacibaculum vairaonense TaxID=3137860 RepID=UPI0031FB8825